MRNSTSVTERLAWSVNEIALRTSLSRTFLRKEIKGGRLPVKRAGRRVLVLEGDLDFEDLPQRLESEVAASKIVVSWMGLVGAWCKRSAGDAFR
jgi:hypothetical protein